MADVRSGMTFRELESAFRRYFPLAVTVVRENEHAIPVPKQFPFARRGRPGGVLAKSMWPSAYSTKECVFSEGDLHVIDCSSSGNAPRAGHGLGAES